MVSSALAKPANAEAAGAATQRNQNHPLDAARYHAARMANASQLTQALPRPVRVQVATGVFAVARYASVRTARVANNF